MKFLPGAITGFIIYSSVTWAFADIGYKQRQEYRDQVKKTTAAHAPKKELPEGIVTTGTITALSLDSKTLRLLTSDGQSLDISLSGFWDAGIEDSLQSLEVGQTVKVTYYRSSAGNAAQFVDVVPKTDAAS
jgi:hypothetical protein